MQIKSKRRRGQQELIFSYAHACIPKKNDRPRMAAGKYALHANAITMQVDRLK